MTKQTICSLQVADPFRAHETVLKEAAKEVEVAGLLPTTECAVQIHHQQSFRTWQERNFPECSPSFDAVVFVDLRDEERQVENSGNDR